MSSFILGDYCSNYWGEIGEAERDYLISSNKTSESSRLGGLV
jgi:hypothetical protein